MFGSGPRGEAGNPGAGTFRQICSRLAAGRSRTNLEYSSMWWRGRAESFYLRKLLSKPPKPNAEGGPIPSSALDAGGRSNGRDQDERRPLRGPCLKKAAADKIIRGELGALWARFTQEGPRWPKDSRRRQIYTQLAAQRSAMKKQEGDGAAAMGFPTRSRTGAAIVGTNFVVSECEMTVRQSVRAALHVVS